MVLARRAWEYAGEGCGLVSGMALVPVKNITSGCLRGLQTNSGLIRMIYFIPVYKKNDESKTIEI